MLTERNFFMLKKVNVSIDAEKTKQRVAQDFKSADKEQKNEIITLTSLQQATIYRVFDTGKVNARIVLAMSQVLGISPFWYTGEIDDQKSLQDGDIQHFLKNHGYKKILEDLEKPKRMYKNTVTAPTDETNSSDTADGETLSQKPIPPVPKPQNETTSKLDIHITLPNLPKAQQTVAELTEEEATQLLHSLFIRARTGGDSEQLAETVKRLLLA